MFSTFIKEFKNLFQSKWRIVSYVLLLFIPMIYSSIVISSFAKPFHNAHNLKVVVVNLDKKPDNTPESQSAELVKYLKNKNGAKLGKKFLKYNIEDASSIYTSASQIDQAVRNGEVAAAIVIPKGYTKAFQQLIPSALVGVLKPFDPKSIADFFINTLNPRAGPDHRVQFLNGYKYNFIKGEMTNLASAIAEFHKHILAPITTSTKFFSLLSANTKASLVHQEILGSNIDTYGKGFSPFFVSISLWAGALAATFVIKNKRYFKGHKGTFRTFFGKMFVWQITSFIQATLLTIGITLLGVLPATGWPSAWQLWLYVVFVSAVFSLMMQALGSMFRFADIGKFIGVIVLIIDLVASSGSFPAFMLPKFFEIISDYIPFTYVIKGMREILWEPNASEVLTQMGYLLIFPAILIPLSLMMNFIHDHKTKKNTLEYDSFEITTGDL
ncbi:MAG: YhgE/Pip family protein [Mycoplasmataceae bacterium]|nr:YhgE/Pip family protein [Mycoplasmataceae bacterium]